MDGKKLHTNVCKWLQVELLRGLSWVWRRRQIYPHQVCNDLKWRAMGDCAAAMLKGRAAIQEDLDRRNELTRNS